MVVVSVVFVRQIETWLKGKVLVWEHPSLSASPSTGLDLKAFAWLRDCLPIFPKIAVRQSMGGCWAAEGNSKPCKSPRVHTVEPTYKVHVL